MRLILTLLTLFTVTVCGWYVWDRYPQLHQKLEEKVGVGDFNTFKIRYSAEALMEAHKAELLKDKSCQYLEPRIAYLPYLLMDIKYAKDPTTTQEGVLLWGLTDGEMVIDAMNWEKTHGFEDCLHAKASKNDFKIIRALVESGGALDREKIYSKFRVENELIDEWLDSCRRKKLVVIAGNKFRLHFQNPKLEITPMTRLDEWLVTQPSKHTVKAKRHYHPEEIKQFTYDLFGTDFVIRALKEVYLPVITLSVQNADGSVLVTHWNALSGKRLDESLCRRGI